MNTLIKTSPSLVKGWLVKQDGVVSSPDRISNRKDDTMKNLLLITFCLLASALTAQETTGTPKRDYAMVNFNSDLTCKLLEIGTTSLTFSVEWSPDRGTPGLLDIIGKLYPETRGWSVLYEIDVNQDNREFFSGNGWDSRFPKEVDLAQRKAIFEVQYRVFWWNRWQKEREQFSKWALFSVNFSIPEENRDSVYWKENKEEEKKPPVATAKTEVQEGEKTSSSQGKVAKQDGVVVEQEKSENESNPNRLWLYAGILLLICAGFYVLRRKLKTGN